MRTFFFLIMILWASPSLATTIKEIKTEGGFTAWLVEERSQPLISVSIVFKDSGTAYDPKGKYGRSFMTSEMLLEGAGDMDSETFAKAVESLAIRLSSSVGKDHLYLGLNTLSEYKKEAFQYLGLALTAPRFDTKPLKRTKRQVVSFIEQNRKKTSHRLNRAWKKQIYGNHPYTNSKVGSIKTIKNLRRKDLKQFSRHYLTRENIIISAVGDITPEELSDLLDTHLAGLPDKYTPDVTLKDISIQKEAKETVIEQDIPQTIVKFTMEGIKRENPDYITAYVMNYLLGGGTLTSSLNTALRKNRGLTYSVSSRLLPMQHAALFNGGFSTRNEKAGEAIAVLKRTLKDFREKGIDESELTDAKRFLIGSFVVNLDSNVSVVNFLAMMQLHHLGIDYINKRDDLINAVTVEQVNKMAKKLIQLDKLQIVMIGKPKLDEAKKP